MTNLIDKNKYPELPRGSWADLTMREALVLGAIMSVSSGLTVVILDLLFEVVGMLP